MNPDGATIKQDRNKITFLTLAFIVFLAIIIGTIVILIRNKQTNPVNYANPFSTQLQKKTQQNPFAQPTTAFQNPFVQTQGQTTNKPYQNPFGGGQ